MTDAIAEANETVTATIASGTAYLVGTPASASATIYDTAFPVVSISASDAIAGEPGSNTGTFAIARTGPTTAGLTIGLATSGTAAPATDFAAMPTSIAIAAGQPSASRAVTPIDDAIAEGPETVTVTLVASPLYRLGTGRSATVRIDDNEPIDAAFAAGTVFTLGDDAPTSAVAVDLNRDRRPDLVATSNGRSRLCLLVNTTPVGAQTPEFAAEQNVPCGVGPWQVESGDLDGDGLPDLVVVDFDGDGVSILRNITGAGATRIAFAPSITIATGDRPERAALADLNGDGKLDIIVANFGSGTLSLLRNTTPVAGGALAFAAKADLAVTTFPGLVAAGDLDADGKADVAVVGILDGEVRVLRNSTATGATTISFAAPVSLFSDRNYACGLAFADMTGDGKPDLTISYDDDGSVWGFANTTPTGGTTLSFAAPATFDLATRLGDLAISDANGDGRADLAVAMSNGDAIAFRQHAAASGYALQPTVVLTTASHPLWTAFADINQDAKPDLVAACGLGGAMTVVLNRTGLPSTAPASLQQASAPQMASVGAGSPTGGAGGGTAVEGGDLATAPDASVSAFAEPPLVATGGRTARDGAPVDDRDDAGTVAELDLAIPRTSRVSPLTLWADLTAEAHGTSGGRALRLHRLGAAGTAVRADLAEGGPVTVLVEDGGARARGAVAWEAIPVEGDAAMTVAVGDEVVLAYGEHGRLEWLEQCGVNAASDKVVLAPERRHRHRHRFERIGTVTFRAYDHRERVVGTLVVDVVGLDAFLFAGARALADDCGCGSVRSAGPTTAALTTASSEGDDCPEPAEPNRGVVTSSQTRLAVSVPDTGQAPVPATWNVIHSIVTVNTPSARDLHGKLRLTVKSGDANGIRITPDAIAAPIAVTEPGHSGCGVHDFHTGPQAFEIVGLKPGKVVLIASVDPDADVSGDGVSRQEAEIEIDVREVQIYNEALFDLDPNIARLTGLVGTESPGLRTRLTGELFPGASSGSPVWSWVIGGSKISTYYHDIDDPTQIALPVPPVVINERSARFFWTNIGNPIPLTLKATIGADTWEKTIKFNVKHSDDPNEEFYSSKIPTADTSPNGPTAMYKAVRGHGNWHRGQLLDDGDTPTRAAWRGGERWGDIGMNTVDYNGRGFLDWHVDLLAAHDAWRRKFNIAIPTPMSAPGLSLPSHLLQSPPAGVPARVSRGYQYRRLGECADRHEVGIVLVDWHNDGHVAFSGDMGSPNTSLAMNDDIFWRWHKEVERFSGTWAADQAAVATTTPATGAALTSIPASIVIGFDRAVSHNAPAANVIQISAARVALNGVAATGMTSSADARTFAFTFPASAFRSGSNDVSLIGTRGYAGSMPGSPLIRFSLP
ncbi:MAG TPA: VCBS repeat-containing protein [Planctomycetota bacterium]|nr:VCBS repeat-containing protein [Planctomycetota bacterium]